MVDYESCHPDLRDNAGKLGMIFLSPDVLGCHAHCADRQQHERNDSFFTY
jgi:hypothetical protein